MWTIITALFGGALRILRAIPYQVYLLLAAALLLWWAYSAIYARGDAAARRELSIPLMQAHANAAVRYQQAADAEGRALAYEQGLDACVGERNTMATITSAVLAQRDKVQASMQRNLNATRKELSDAYASTADRCADQPVPDAVVRVLDAAAFGPASTGADSVSAGAGAAVRARTVSADGTDPDSPQARTTYRDLAGWIAAGWAPGLHSCNADKAGLALLHSDSPWAPQP